MKHDVSIENHGSIVLFRLLTRKAKTWVSSHVSDDCQFFGNALAVEPRYADNLVSGMESDGLAVS